MAGRIRARGNSDRAEDAEQFGTEQCRHQRPERRGQSRRPHRGGGQVELALERANVAAPPEAPCRRNRQSTSIPRGQTGPLSRQRIASGALRKCCPPRIGEEEKIRRFRAAKQLSLMESKDRRGCPAASSLSSQARPPCSSARPCTSAKPSPVPWPCRSKRLSTWLKGLKTHVHLSGGMPGPLSSHHDLEIAIRLGAPRRRPHRYVRRPAWTDRIGQPG